MTELSYSDSIEIAVSPQSLYDMVADITRVGEWSPVCRECWWDDGAGPVVGAWFTGRNERPGRVWETRSQVVVAEPGREFAWQVGGSWAQWGYRIAAVPGGARLTESWDFLPDGIAMFHERYAEQAQAEIEARGAAAREGIPATLAAIKAAAEPA